MRLISAFRKVTCLYCFERFRPCDAPVRSTSLYGPTEPDVGVGDFLGVVPPEMRPVESAPARNRTERWRRRVFDTYDSTSDRKRVCPRCHMFLPHKTATGELSSEILAIVGARNAGKSNFIGVLINALEGRYAGDAGFTMYAQDTFSVREMRSVSSNALYRARYGSRLFSPQPVALTSTRSAVDNHDIRIPLIYRLQFSQRFWQKLADPFSQRKALDLAMFDAAGEDLESTAMRQQFARYTAAASGIIFLIDPFALPGIPELLPPSQRSHLPLQGDWKEVIEGAINVFEQRNGLRANEKISVPVAIAITKTDMLKDIIDNRSPMMQDNRHIGGFDQSDCQECSEDVQRHLAGWGCKKLLNLVRDRFEHYQYFGVSALGQSPGEDQRLSTISPKRIADPLLWLLSKRGYLS